MFENIIEQGAVFQLRDDISSGRSAPSMLFFGPAASGKGSAALELARVLSCNEESDWKCSCSSCKQHRFLQHDDLLILGSRSFASEIAACRSAFLRNTGNANAKLLFFRSLRKLMLRFSPVLMEEDQKLSKCASVLQSLDEKLNEYLETPDVSEKFCDSLVKDALSLENDGLSANVPIGQIRSASYWSRLAPMGKRKIFIIENAENMRDEARNSLLKLLEEPPPSVSIVLTAQRRETIMPTILSRLRPYRFLKRSEESEKEVIRRIYSDNGVNLSEYFDSFLTQSAEKIESLAAWFIVSLARIVSVSIKKKEGNIPAFINALGERYAPIAEKAGLERCLKSSGVIKIILSQSKNFEDVSFSRFLKNCLDMVNTVTRASGESGFIAYNDIFRKHINEAVTAVDVLNINAAIALESLFFNLKTSFAKRIYG
jgi:DNA polymerase-3 subunit gamma/tau